MPLVPGLGAPTDPSKPHPQSGGLAVWRFGWARPAQMWPGYNLGPGYGKGAVWEHLEEAPSGAEPCTWGLCPSLPLPWVMLTPCLSLAMGPVGPNALIWILPWLWTCLSCRYIWRPPLLAEPGCHGWASSACLALPCPDSPVMDDFPLLSKPTLSSPHHSPI